MGDDTNTNGVRLKYKPVPVYVLTLLSLVSEGEREGGGERGRDIIPHYLIIILTFVL